MQFNVGLMLFDWGNFFAIYMVAGEILSEEKIALVVLLGFLLNVENAGLFGVSMARVAAAEMGEDEIGQELALRILGDTLGGGVLGVEGNGAGKQAVFYGLGVGGFVYEDVGLADDGIEPLGAVVVACDDDALRWIDLVGIEIGQVLLNEVGMGRDAM